MIIPIIIQTILLDPPGAVWTDEASNLSRPDPSGAIQSDCEHPSRNRNVEGSSVAVGPEGRWVARHWPLPVWENAAPAPLHGVRYAEQARCTGTSLASTDMEEGVSRR